jgi:hypothetical protein
MCIGQSSQEARMFGKTYSKCFFAIFAVSFFALATMAHANSSGSSEIPETLRLAVSDAMGHDDPAYHATQEGAAWLAKNSAQKFEATWNDRGLAVHSENVSWGLQIVGWGYSDQPANAGPALPQVKGNRVKFDRGELTEWYFNGPDGVEQGFTVQSPPGNASSKTPLTLRLACSGNLPVRVEDNAAVVAGLTGEPVLRYSGLKAYDAAGKSLHSWLEQRGSDILVRVDDKGATYPVVIDPLIQSAELTASDGATHDMFGFSVSLSADGSTALIGAYRATVGGNAEQGAAYVFVKNNGIWTQQKKLTASDGAAWGHFGFSVSLSSGGATALIGTLDDTSGGKGAAYVFVKNNGIWTQQKKLTASDGAAGDHFGISVSINSNGSTALIGAIATVGGNQDQGAAYVFVKNNGTWSQQKKLTASDGAEVNYFGSSVSLSANGSTALIGAYYADGWHGAAYVFVRNNGTWSQQKKLTASDGSTSDRFGISVSLNGDGSTALVGAGSATFGGNQYRGAAYVFVKNNGTWTQKQKLTASDGAAHDYFGTSVSLSGNGATALISATSSVDGSNYYRGAAYVFVRNNGTWTQKQKLTASDGAQLENFGYSLSLTADGSTALIGTWDLTTDGKGAAYVFTLISYSIFGAVTHSGTGLPGVTIDLTGAAVKNTTTDSNGFYRFDVLFDGIYTVTPSISGYTFSIPSRSVSVIGGDVTVPDFAASPITHSISGTVMYNFSGIQGVTMGLTGAATKNAITNVEGKYIFTGLANGVYMVTPSSSWYTFNPEHRSLNISGADKSASFGAQPLPVPAITSFKIARGKSTTTSRTVSLNNKATGKPASYMAGEASDFSGATWLTWSAAPSFILSNGGGTKRVYFKVENAAGESTSVSDTIELIVPPAVKSFQINSGATATSSRKVTLNNTTADNPAQFMASESSSFSGAKWKTYSKTPSFTLSASKGTKTVYFKVKNAAGESNSMSDSIELQ